MLAKTDMPLILLVEDSDDDAFFFGRTLEKSGLKCSMRHVLDGAEAIDFLRKASDSLPQTIFLDLKMPIVNGFEVLEWIRTQTFPTHMQVVVLSGSEHEDDKERAAQLGATDYLVKPVKVHDLHRLLRDVCALKMGAAV
jgi:CheY-like chemotaxis protein